MIPILTDSAICMCPHGGRLQFIVTHMKADGMDGKVLTLMEYSSAMIVGCANPPISGGPCLTVALAQDPIGRVMTINGNTVVTPMVISITNLGLPIIVVSPGNSAISIMLDPSIFPPRKVEFMQGSVDKMGVSADTGAASATRSIRTFKDVITAYWGSDYARREQSVKLQGTTVGFGDGTPATLLVYEYDLDGNHAFVERLSGTVESDRVEVEWPFEYQGDVDALASLFEGDEYYAPPEYFFELKVGGKTARSGLLQFIDSIDIELVEEETEAPISNADFVAHLADGSARIGALDAAGKASLVDIPPGRVHWEFVPRRKRVVSASWGTARARREEVVTLIGEVSGFATGTSASFRIFRQLPDGSTQPLHELGSTVKDDRVETEWTVDIPERIDDSAGTAGIPASSTHDFVFDVVVEDRSMRSASLQVEEAVVCLRLIGMYFDTNKNFLLPDALAGMRTLVDIYEEHPDSELLVVGHADRSGEPAYNDVLSLERADSVAAFLTDDVAAWLARYDQSVRTTKRWGKREDLLMLGSLPDFSSKPDGDSAVEWFQRTRGLTVDNIAGPQTRRQLVTEYMAHDRTTLPADLTIVTHGCGENFPLDDSGEIDTAAPDEEQDARDRRVEMYFFDPPGIRPPPKGKNSGPADTEYLEWRRRVTETHNLKGRGQIVGTSQITYLLRSNSGCIPLANLRYRLDVGSRVIEGRTDGDGLIAHHDLLPGDYELEIQGVKSVLGTLPDGAEPPLHEVRGFFVTELD